MNAAMRLARDGTADSIDNTHTKSTTLEAITHGQDGIGGFTGLRYEDADIVAEDRGLAIKEVGGKFDRNWDFCKFLEDGSGLLTANVYQLTDKEVIPARHTAMHE